MLNFKFSLLLILLIDFQNVDSKRSLNDIKYHVNLRLTWQSRAKDYCTLKQMELLTPNTMEQLDELREWLDSWVTDSWEPDPTLVYYFEEPENMKYRYWLSATRKSNNDPYYWPNGTLVTGLTKRNNAGDSLAFAISLDGKSYELSNVGGNWNYVTVCEDKTKKLQRSSDPLEECFYISQQKLSYYEALQFCHHAGLSLVSVENNEKEYVLNFALYSAGRHRRTRDENKPIIYRTSGNSYTNHDGTYTWLLGDPILHKTPKTRNGDPLLIKSFEQILYSMSDPSEEHYFICDVPKTKFFNSDIEKKYYFSDKKETFFIADRICQENKMQLLSIQDSDKAYDLRKRIPPDSTRYWTSGLKIPQTNIWLWANSAVAKYFNWESDEPDPDSKKHCIEVFEKDGNITFASQFCELKRKFICENDLPKVNMHCVKYHPNY